MNFHFLSLEKMVLGLFTDWRDHIELSCYRIGFLGREKIAAGFILMESKPALWFICMRNVRFREINTNQETGRMPNSRQSYDQQFHHEQQLLMQEILTIFQEGLG